ncbi:MAG TPA: hypothetical protein VGL81_24005 [Polyangiaceae bacterium]|jgi:hypothetical protein
MVRPSRDQTAVVCPATGPVAGSRPAARGAPSDPSAARPWRCRACGALLGVERNGEVHVKYKEVQHWISGRCRHHCRRCGTMNVLSVGAPDLAAVTVEGRR